MKNLLWSAVNKKIRNRSIFIENEYTCGCPKTKRKKRLKAVGMMVWLLRKCVECGEYTINEERCPVCGGNLRIPHPAKFSPEDKYAKYRRAMRGLGQNEKVSN